MPKRTARQLKEYDIVADTFGVLSVEKTADPFGVQVFKITYIDASGAETVVKAGGNTVLEVARPDLGECDPTNNPYWWGMERRQERADDERVADAELAMEDPWSTVCGGGGRCDVYDRCNDHRDQDARAVAHLGAGAMHRARFRAYND